jgi:hypothetical protein
MRAHWLLLPLVVACKATPNPSDDSDDSAPSVPEDAPYLLDDSNGAPVTVDTPAVEAALAAAIAAARSTNAQPALNSYATAAAGASADCPSRYTDGNGLPYWNDACTTDGGTTFSGYGYAIDYLNTDNGDGYLWTGSGLYTAATVTTPDALTFTGSGSAYALRGIAGDGTIVYYSVVSGQFTWDGAEAEGTWLTGSSPNMTMWLTENSGTHGAYFTGSVPISAPGFDVAVLEETSVASANAGWPCPGEIAGSVSVHSVEGVWYQVVFDGGWTQDAATCDQCGTVWVDGVPQAEACVDASAWVDWDGSPW